MIKLAKDGLQYFCVFPAIAQVITPFFLWMDEALGF